MIQKDTSRTRLDKPPLIGVTISELSKVLMYDFQKISMMPKLMCVY